MTCSFPSNAACVFLFLSAMLNLIDRGLGNPPRLIPNVNTSQVEASETFSIRCESESPVKWRLESQDPTIKERTNITDERTGWTGNTYATTLSLKNAQYLDVGFITCSHEDNESEKAQTYLFVDDPTHLLLPMDPKPVIVSQYNSVLIPCRPTSEDVSVVLNKDSTPLDLDFADISFDPTEGFLIRSAVFEKHHGLFTCFATHPSGSKESKTFVLMVKVGGITLDPPKIDASNAEFVVLGQSLRLSCFADVERHVVPHMAWEWPNKNAENEGRIDLSPLTEDTSFPSRRTLRMNLTVRAVTEQDEGRYTCRIRDSTGNMESDAVYMNDFHQPGESHLRLRPQGGQSGIRVSVGDREARWVVEVHAYPPNPSLKWYRNGELITGNTPGGKYKIDTSDKRTILIVYNIKLEDFGEYLLVGQVGDKQEQLTVIMQVDSAPVLTLSGQSDDDYYSINQQYTFRCAVEAYPEPNITWRYRKCSEPYLCSSSFVEILEPGYNGETVHPITNATPFNSESVLTVTARESGYYQCSAENREGSADEDINFVVTEVPGGLGFLDAPNGQLTEGFVFNLTCAASRKNYTDEMLWYFKGEGQQDPFILESGAGWLVHQSNSKYSFYSTIRQEKLIMKHAGVYTCAVQKIGATEKENVEVTLDIKPIILPKLNAMSNMIPGVTDQITLEQGDPLTLNCTVDSNPPAEITWMKDGHPLELDESARRVFFLDTEPSRQVLFFQYTLSEHDPGFYTCLADNKKGVTEGQVTLAVTGGGKDAKMGTGYVILVAALGGFILILLPVLIWYYRKWKVAERKLLSKEEENQMRFGNKEDIDFNEEVGGQASNLPISNEFEFPEKNLVIQEGKPGKLGQGAFGQVRRATAIGIVVGEPQTEVAVKSIKMNVDTSAEDKKTFLEALTKEMKIMAYIGRHLNIVNLLGHCTKHLSTGKALLILEYCPFGSLEEYLKKHQKHFIDELDVETGQLRSSVSEDLRSPRGRYALAKEREALAGARQGGSRFSTGSTGYVSNNGTSDVDRVPPLRSHGQRIVSTASETANLLTSDDEGYAVWARLYVDERDGSQVHISTTDLLSWAYQVACGMEFLAARKVVHRDLAARNILLTFDNVVKICDFGLARDTQKEGEYKIQNQQQKLPLRWMAPESIEDHVFSFKSDVWSYGITMWEIFNLGGYPFKGANLDAYNFLQHIKNPTNLPQQPKYCPHAVYQVMQECWKYEPEERPHFGEIQNRLHRALPQPVTEHLSELSEPYRSAHQVTDEGSTRRHTSRTSRLSSGGGNALPRIIETAPEPPTTDDGYIIPSPRTAPLAEEETVSVPLRDQIRAFPYRSYPPRYSQLGNQESMTEENEMREYANTTPSPERNSTAHYQTPRSNPVPLSSSPPPDYNAGVDYRFPVPQRAPSSSSSNSSGIHSHSEDEGRADEDASPPPSRSMSPGKRAPSYSRVAEHQV